MEKMGQSRPLYRQRLARLLIFSESIFDDSFMSEFQALVNAVFGNDDFSKQGICNHH
jgi:hypothetical protein